MLNKFVFVALLAGLLAGCGGKSGTGKEATLADMNRAVSTVTMMNGGRPPQSIDAITNLLNEQGLRLPTRPAGKKLIIDARGQVAFADQ